MNFFFTKYIYPISAPLIISRNLKFSLDNPRTENELLVVKEHLEKSISNSGFAENLSFYYNIPIFTTPETEGILTLESVLRDFFNNYSTSDEYVNFFHNEHLDESPLEILARMWIIARYDDEGEHERLLKAANEMSKNGHNGLFMIDSGNPIVDNSESLINYSYLLSLLFNTDNKFYYGQSFIINDHSFEIQYPQPNKWINKSVLYFGMIVFSVNMSHIEDKWNSFYHIRSEIVNISNKLDCIIDESNKEKILYISNLLKVIGNEIDDERYKLVTLVSIIELLLTHSPDHNRFNIEESISKQFRLKTAILVYQNDKDKSLDWIKERLRDIYNQRSSIAHGNFKNLQDYIKKERKKTKDEDISDEMILERLIFDTYTFTKAILEEYIKDRKLVEFLKDN